MALSALIMTCAQKKWINSYVFRCCTKFKAVCFTCCEKNLQYKLNLLIYSAYLEIYDLIFIGYDFITCII